MGLFNKTPEEKAAAKEALQAELSRAKESVKSKREEIMQAMSGEFPNSTPLRLFNAVLLAGADRKYSVVSIDRASYSVTFQSNKGEKFWDGRISCFIIPLEGSCRLSVSGNSEQGATTSGFAIQNFSPFSQLASDGAVASEVNKFKVAIVKQFDRTPEPPAEVTQQGNVNATSTDIPSQLKQLKQLFDEGVLTQEEFDRAKSKLLS